MMNLHSIDKKLTLQYLKPKYFFVGLTATGNRTAGKAMAMLGYRWLHFPHSLEQICPYEVVTDVSIAMWFRKGLLPCNGNYIITIRNLENWLNDCHSWYESSPYTPGRPVIFQQNRQYLYQGLTYDRERFIDSYHKHNEECEVMAKRMGVKLHKWNVVEDPTWNLLNQLTGKITDQPFPFNPGIYPKTLQEVKELRKINPALIPESSDDMKLEKQ
jgi:hypothetical protein